MQDFVFKMYKKFRGSRPRTIAAKGATFVRTHHRAQLPDASSPSLILGWLRPCLWRRTTKFDVVTHVGRGVYVGVSHASHPKTAEFQRSTIVRVLLYLWVHPLTQNDQIRHGNTYGRSMFSWQPRHCICTNASRGLSATADQVSCSQILLIVLQQSLPNMQLKQLIFHMHDVDIMANL